MSLRSTQIWQWTFWTVLAFYVILYAPFGINESDGGFMTGFAWQLLSGKKLYNEIFYVRPPLPVWLRAAEIWLLPEQWQILGERCIFFSKVALYSFLAANFFIPKWTWQASTFAFVLSVHCYPPSSLHTFDGILFSVLAFWFYGKKMPFAAGLAVCCAVACKQSFYPIPIVLLTLAFLENQKKDALRIAVGGLLAAFFLGLTLYHEGTLSEFFRRTAGASNFQMLWQQGILNLFRINPLIAIGSLIFGLLFFAESNIFPNENKRRQIAIFGLIIWLSITYVFQVWQRQTFTPPVAQSRILFWISIGWAAYTLFLEKNQRDALRFLALLSISWCCTVSWGYSYPIQFAAPATFVFFKILYRLPFKNWATVAVLCLLIFAFRVGYEFNYRDGQRYEMRYHIGDIFPKARGIYSTESTFSKFAELKFLWEKYPNEKVVLPWFGQAHFFTNSHPTLPLDWVANREMNSDTTAIFKILNEKSPTIFIQKSLLLLIVNDPEHTVSQHVISNWRQVASGEFFLVFQKR